MPVPRPEMIIFLPSEKELFQVQRSEFPVEPGKPLRHAVIVGIFTPGPKFVVFALKPICPFSRRRSNATVRRNATEFNISSGDQPRAGFECEGCILRVSVNDRRRVGDQPRTGGKTRRSER